MKKLTKKERQKVGPLIRRARKLMNSEGRHWLQRKLFGSRKGETSYCAIGGLNAAAGAPQRYMSWRSGSRRILEEDYPVLAEARIVLATAISGRRPSNIDEAENIIFTWNDDHSRRWEDVSHVFQDASERADELAE